MNKDYKKGTKNIVYSANTPNFLKYLLHGYSFSLLKIIFISLFHHFFNVRSNFIGADSWAIVFYNLSVSVDQEFGKVPRNHLSLIDAFII